MSTLHMSSARTLRRWCAAALRRWCASALLGGALLALLTRVPCELATDQLFPAHSPAALAHHLADFSLQPHVVSWWVEEDYSNYTTWRYAVSFSCGELCAGRAHVLAHDEPRAAAAPQHGHAARLHRVVVTRAHCTRLPLLPWPISCEELETSAVVIGVGDGARLREVAHTRCSVAGALSGACARSLRAQRDLRLQRLHHTVHSV